MAQFIGNAKITKTNKKNDDLVFLTINGDEWAASYDRSNDCWRIPSLNKIDETSGRLVLRALSEATSHKDISRISDAYGIQILYQAQQVVPQDPVAILRTKVQGVRAILNADESSYTQLYAFLLENSKQSWGYRLRAANQARLLLAKNNDLDYEVTDEDIKAAITIA